MGPFELLNHLLNFTAPAAAVALGLTLAGRLMTPASATRRGWVLALVLFAVGTAVLIAGLAVTGRDGAMSTYAALVVACATAHWLLTRAWRR